MSAPVQWEYYDKQYVPYNAADNATVEALYQSHNGTGRVTFSSTAVNFSYSVDFDKMTQQNTSTKVVRQLRRTGGVPLQQQQQPQQQPIVPQPVPKPVPAQPQPQQQAKPQAVAPQPVPQPVPPQPNVASAHTGVLTRAQRQQQGVALPPTAGFAPFPTQQQQQQQQQKQPKAQKTTTTQQKQSTAASNNKTTKQSAQKQQQKQIQQPEKYIQSDCDDDDDDSSSSDEDQHHKVIDYSKINVPDPFDPPLPCRMTPARSHIQTSDYTALHNPVLDIPFADWAYFKQCPTKLKLLRSQLEQVEADIKATPPPPPRQPKAIKPSSIVVTPLDVSTYKRNLKSSTYFNSNQQQSQQQQQHQSNDDKENINTINNNQTNNQQQQSQQQNNNKHPALSTPFFQHNFPYGRIHLFESDDEDNRADAAMTDQEIKEITRKIQLQRAQTNNIKLQQAYQAQLAEYNAKYPDLQQQQQNLQQLEIRQYIIQQQLTKIDAFVQKMGTILQNTKLQPNTAMLEFDPEKLRFPAQFYLEYKIKQILSILPISPGFAPITISTLPLTDFETDKQLQTATNEQFSDQDQCAICFCECSHHTGSQPQADEDKVTVLPCKHPFHIDCIQPHFETQGNCPTCRRDIFFSPGPAPFGNVTITYGHEHVPGDERVGHIRCTFSLQGGVQDARQKHNPGQPYGGVTRQHFIPATQRGFILLRNYIKAFICLHMFAIGRSLTTHADNQIVYGAIHCKSELAHGSHSYPDPNFYEKAKSELTDNGFPEDGL